MYIIMETKDRYNEDATTLLKYARKYGVFLTREMASARIDELNNAHGTWDKYILVRIED